MSAPPVRVLCLAGVLALGLPLASSAQTSDPYFEFITALRLEKAGDGKAALDAYERAAAAAPKSAEIRAEIAAFHMRGNQPQEAEAAARAALALDPECVEAHRVLGLLLGGTAERMREAVGHLEKVMALPSGATDVQLQLTLGRLYLFTNALPKAIEVLRRVVEEQPYIVQARITLAQALAASERPDEAMEVLEPAAQTDPRVGLTLAQMYERAGRGQEAAALFGRLAASNPGSREAQMRYAAALLALPSPDAPTRALTVLATLIERNARDTGALYLQSQAYRRTGDVFAAERAARAILAADPKSVSGSFALAQVLAQSRRYKDVVDLLEPLTSASATRTDNTLNLLTMLSGAYQAMGNWDKSIETLTRAKALAPDSGVAIDAYLIQAHVSARRFTEAATLAEAARTRNGDDLRFTYLQARALFLGGSKPAAYALLETAIASKPEEMESYLTLAELYGNGGRADDGLKLLDRAAQRFPDKTALTFRRGAILAEAKRDVDAEQAFRQVLAAQPDNGPALNYLGYMLAERGRRLDEAIDLITRALKTDADNPSYLDSLGWALFKRGDLADADTHLSKASDALPQNSVVQDHYGDVLARLGRYREAIMAWTKALGGDGSDIDRVAIERKLRDARGKAK